MPIAATTSNTPSQDCDSYYAYVQPTGSGYHIVDQQDEDEDLVVDLNTCSLQATNLKNWLMITEVLDKLEKLWLPISKVMLGVTLFFYGFVVACIELGYFINSIGFFFFFFGFAGFKIELFMAPAL